MNLKLTLTVLCAMGFYLNAYSQTTAADGDWSKYYVNMKHTPEADQMVRFGDVDNLGFGWGLLNPFNGDITPKHAFPWKRNVNDTIGMDMVMVISSNTLHEAALTNCNGYSTEKKTLLNEFGKTNFEIKFPLNLDKEIKIEKMMMQMFLVDVQSKRNNLQYRVYINNRRAEFMERTINNLDQTGELGKLVSFYVPQEFFNEFTKKDLHIMMDDSISPVCEGFAIDFIKILVNPVSTPPTQIKLILRDKVTFKPITAAKISIDALDRIYMTDSKGELILTKLPLGNLAFTAVAQDYMAVGFYINVDAESQEQIIYMSNTQPTDVYTPSTPTPSKQPPVIADENVNGLFWQLLKVVFNNHPSTGSSTNTGSGKTNTETGATKTQTETMPTSPTKTIPSTRRR